jgi:branched-chain amino acid transport system substrate-binding protein
LGIDLPLSGPNAANGKLFNQFITWGVNYVNKNHLIDGSLNLSFYDSQGLPGPAVSGIQQLIEVKKSIAVFTAQSSPTAAIVPTADRYQVPLMNGGANSPNLANAGPYLFSDLPLVNQEFPAELPYVVKDLHDTRWAVLYTTETLGESLLQGLQQELPPLGAKVVSAVGIDPSLTNFESQLVKIEAAKPDVLFFASNANGPEYPTLVSEESAAGMKVTNVSYPGPDVPEVLQDPQSNGIIFPSADLSASIASTSPETKALVADYQQQYGKGATPSSYAVQWFNNVLLVADAISNLQQAHQNVTGPAIRQQFLTQTFAKVAGPAIKYKSDGTISPGVIDLMQISGGKTVILSKTSVK